MKRRTFLRSSACVFGGGVVGISPVAAEESIAQPGADPTGDTIREPARDVSIVHECDVCVVGGSCTGVFAAVTAARLGARVALVEQDGFFGGVATAGLVNIWHSLFDQGGRQQIIAGLTAEMVERLRQRDACNGHIKGLLFLNPEVLKLELDKLVVEHEIRPFLHTMFAAPAVTEHGRVEAVFVQDKSGRRAIRARVFVDATGDGDLVHRTGLETYRREHVQPPTMCCVLRAMDEIRKKHPELDIHHAVFDKKYEQAIPRGWAWSAPVPGGDELLMLAATRVFGADCSDADQLTQATLEGRRQVDNIVELLRQNFMGGKGLPLGWLPARIGIRESRHSRCLHELKAEELLRGERFPDAIANGTYHIDVHSATGSGVKFTGLHPGVDFYQIPYRSLVPKGAKNVLVAGRHLDADQGAFGGVRVMVNLNQTGEAAGTAAWLALDTDTTIDAVDSHKLRATMAKQGSVIL